MSEKKLVPKLRFVDESWDTQKLGNICKITMGQSPSSSNYSENKEDTVLIQGNADLINGEVVPRVYTSEITKTSKPGDIILTVRAPVGDLAINEFNSCIGRGVCSIDGDKFIYYFLQSLKDKHVWERLSQGSTFESINSNDIKNLKIKMPSEKTQKSISNFLTSIDVKIRLLEKKYNYYQDFKKFLMQQIFAQKLRFNEFDDEWKTVKLSNVAEIVGGGTPNTEVEEYWNGGIKWFTPSEIGKTKYISESDRYISEEGLKNSSAKLLPKNTILLSSRATVGEISIALTECSTNQGFQSLITKNTVDNEFIYYLISTLKNEFLRRSSGSTFLEISKNEIKKIKINIPSLSEQKRISSLFLSIDNKIDLLKIEHEKCLCFKKSLLQQMFISILINYLVFMKSIDYYRNNC